MARGPRRARCHDHARAPTVGQVYRPENIPGIVFEEVTVETVGKTVNGPRSPVAGAIAIDELHVDGSHEPKLFAPGYGEFRTSGSGDLEALALAVPTDARVVSVPTEYRTLSTSALAILESIRLEDWETASATIERMNAAWKIVRTDTPPAMVADRLRTSLRGLRSAVRARKPVSAAQAALDVGQSALDLELQYRTPAEIDAARFGLWTQQLRVDAAGNELTRVTGDVAVLEWIRDRFAATLDATGHLEIDARLRDLRVVTDAKNLPAAADHAARLDARLRTLVGPERRG